MPSSRGQLFCLDLNMLVLYRKMFFEENQLNKYIPWVMTGTIVFAVLNRDQLQWDMVWSSVHDKVI